MWVKLHLNVQERAEDLMQLASAAELQRDVAAAAAADASMSATKASDVLIEVTTSISNEMSDTHRRINQFQVKKAQLRASCCIISCTPI